ncbi:hypothetical protein DKM44_03150 [Deinococcus irradiatisoli]|uniref:Uncharacterized protein n=1 Tax=Deinococcus irradiatisoli TaxID=2202254 RepID=A0A2Z3JBJ6_9DEIO|nr:LacI family DNA-binding transcriptional regulator [Deinococcus irradiatisoli]AWN22355.1 hypothetical protein DKM44_03150 [Deinococcus irradiatisoli]
MRVTIKEVAAAAEVSAATVSKVLSGRGAYAVHALTAERVRRVAAELGYVPDMAAKHLRTRRTGQLGVVLEAVGASEPESLLGAEAAQHAAALRRTFDGAIMAGLSGAARERRVPALVVYPGGDMPARHYLDGRVDGLIVSCDPLRGHALLQALSSAPLPLVALWTGQAPAGVCAVDVDHQSGAAQATQHLLGLGHTRIAFYGGGTHGGVEHFRRREAGYRQAMRAAGLRPYAAVHGGAELVGAVRRFQFSAVFAETDLGAAAAYQALSAAGYRVPDDLSLIGFDDVQGAEYIAGGLSTVYHPAAEMAAAGIGLLLERCAGRPVPPRTQIAPRLILRRTTRRWSGP